VLCAVFLSFCLGSWFCATLIFAPKFVFQKNIPTFVVDYKIKINTIKLMKNVFAFIFVISFCYNTFAEDPFIHRPLPRSVNDMTVVDSGYVRVWYALNASDIRKPETYDDMQRLEIGSGISKYFSHFVYNNDSLITDWRKKHKNARGAPSWLGEEGKNNNWSEYYYSEYFKDFGKDTFTEYARMPWGGVPNYQYTEAMPAQIWEMQADVDHCRFPLPEGDLHVQGEELHGVVRPGHTHSQRSLEIRGAAGLDPEGI
jgi:hypothetical protein